MKWFTIGRDPELCDIAICEGEKHEQISRLHMELTVARNARTCYLVDRCSTNGCYVQKDGEWEAITQAEVEWDTPLLLGNYLTSAKELINQT